MPILNTRIAKYVEIKAENYNKIVLVMIGTYVCAYSDDAYTIAAALGLVVIGHPISLLENTVIAGFPIMQLPANKIKLNNMGYEILVLTDKDF